MPQDNDNNLSDDKIVIPSGELPIYADTIVKFKITPYTTMLIFGNDTDKENEFNEVKTIALPTPALIDALLIFSKTLSKDEVKSGLSSALNNFVKQIASFD